MYSTPTLWLWSFAFTTYNPLHVACRLGDVEMVQLLLNHGLNPNLLDKIAGEPLTLRQIFEMCRGRPANITNVVASPLHVAVMHGHTEVIDVLARYNANMDLIAKTSWFSKSMRVPPVFVADAADVMECLIRHRTNFLIVPGKGNARSVTALQRAQMHSRAELATVLEAWGGDVALTPLHEAAAAGDLATVRHLLSWGLHPDQLGEFQVGVNYRTPLHWASIMGRQFVVAELATRHADVNARDAMGRTALHWALRHNHVQTASVLLTAGADPLVHDHIGLLPLGCGAESGLLSGAMVDLFVQHRVDMNARMMRTGDTPLHLALRNGHRESALALIERGDADVNCLNNEGLRAIECCASADLQFAVKVSSKWVDVVLSFDAPYRSFAERVKRSIEENHITVFMRESDDDGAGMGMGTGTASDGRDIPDSRRMEASKTSMEELAYAKEVQVPVVAISCGKMNLSEELQVYLFTRQIVPFGDAIDAVSPPPSHTDVKLGFTINDERFKSSLQSLIDGLRDEVELHRQGAYRANDLTSDAISLVELPRGSSGRSSAPSVATSLHTSSTRNMLSPRSSARGETFRRRTFDDIVRDAMARKSRPLLSLTPHTPFSVFLAHGDCHHGFVTKLHAELRRHRIPVKLDSMTHMSSMKERILAAKDAILQSSVFLVVLSEQSVKTELVSDQLAFAEDKGKLIVPVYYSKRPDLLDSTLRQLLDEERHALVFGNDLSFGRGFEELMEEIRIAIQEMESTNAPTAGLQTTASDSRLPLSPGAESAARLFLQRSRAKAASTEARGTMT
ncbi:hypothetical protein PINS_up002995 [Pythium insidiosum]|nr:hypothetical protein PINS_up002995 [Pythium insidiosum]